jgi:predicted LPLAT superfamily acyltransferase
MRRNTSPRTYWLFAVGWTILAIVWAAAGQSIAIAVLYALAAVFSVTRAIRAR